jgi:LacI family transcriptional regulator, xylobiose transport system transcriptional regulator
MTNTRPADSVRLAEVAEEAGVSLSTISKVLNGRSDVSRRTRVRVEELLERSGYQRQRKVRANTPLIELVFHELDAVWSMEIIRGVESAAREFGMNIVLSESGTRHAPGTEWIEGAMRRRPTGVVLVFSDLPAEQRNQLQSRSIPFAIVDPAGDPSPDVPSVGSANWAGGLMATRHLVDLGHRRIAAITGPADMMCSLARVDGYRSALGSAGIPIDESLIRYGDFHVDGGRDNALALLTRPDRPTAIFAGSDLQALGVFDAARTMNLRVPEDISVVGYDDIPLARWASPALTTVHQPLYEMGREACRIVVALSRNEIDEVPRMDLSTSLIVRSSTMAPTEHTTVPSATALAEHTTVPSATTLAEHTTVPAEQ